MSVEIAKTSNGLLQVVVSRDGAVLTIALEGELDLSNVETLDAALGKAEADAALREIIIDMHELRFIDSIGVTRLVDAIKRSSANSNRLRITRSTAEVERVLELTGVNPYLPHLD
jgi:anti-sigma B factor antagonist